MQAQKWQNDLCSFSRQTSQYHGNPSLCPNQERWRSWSWTVLWRPTRPFFFFPLQDLLELTPKKDVFFIIGVWNAKVGSQETPGVTGKFGLGLQNETEQRLIWVFPREYTGHSKHPLPTTQEKTLHIDITRWSVLKSDWWYSLQPKMEKLYTVSKNKSRSWLWLRSWTPYCQIQT